MNLEHVGIILALISTVSPCRRRLSVVVMTVFAAPFHPWITLIEYSCCICINFWLRYCLLSLCFGSYPPPSDFQHTESMNTRACFTRVILTLLVSSTNLYDSQKRLIYGNYFENIFYTKSYKVYPMQKIMNVSYIYVIDNSVYLYTRVLLTTY